MKLPIYVYFIVIAILGQQIYSAKQDTKEVCSMFLATHQDEAPSELAFKCIGIAYSNKF
jgi:hypothetical protein